MPHLPSIAALIALTNAGAAAELPVKSSFTASVFDEANGQVLLDTQAVEIVESPTDNQIAAAMKLAHVHRSKWMCKVLATGRLRGCKLEGAYPQLTNTVRFKHLAEKVVVDKKAAAVARGKGNFVILNAYLAIGDKDEFESCPPGWCPRTMASPATP